MRIVLSIACLISLIVIGVAADSRIIEEFDKFAAEWHAAVQREGKTYCYHDVRGDHSAPFAETIVYLHEDQVMLRQFESTETSWFEHIAQLGADNNRLAAPPLKFEDVLKECRNRLISHPATIFHGYPNFAMVCGIGDPKDATFEGWNIASFVFPPEQCFMVGNRADPLPQAGRVPAPSLNCNELGSNLRFRCSYAAAKTKLTSIIPSSLINIQSDRDASLTLADIFFPDLPSRASSLILAINDPMPATPLHDRIVSAPISLVLRNPDGSLVSEAMHLQSPALLRFRIEKTMKNVQDIVLIRDLGSSQVLPVTITTSDSKYHYLEGQVTSLPWHGHLEYGMHGTPVIRPPVGKESSTSYTIYILLVLVLGIGYFVYRRFAARPRRRPFEY